LRNPQPNKDLVFERTQKAEIIKEIDKLDFIKMKNCPLEDTIKE
jgi:hypothetical protein